MMDMITKAVRWTVGTLLEQKQMSTQDFAKAAGIAYNTALALRRGVTMSIDRETLAKVCTALDCDLSDLLVVDEVDNAPA